MSEPLSIIAVVLLFFIAFLIGVADGLLLIIAGIKLTRKKKRRKEQPDEGYDGIVFNPPGENTGELGQIVIPHSQMGQFLAHMAARKGKPPEGTSPEAKKPEEPKGYI